MKHGRTTGISRRKRRRLAVERARDLRRHRAWGDEAWMHYENIPALRYKLPA